MFFSPPHFFFFSILFVFEAITRLTRWRRCLKKTALIVSLRDSHVQTLDFLLLPQVVNKDTCCDERCATVLRQYMYGSIYVLCPLLVR